MTRTGPGPTRAEQHPPKGKRAPTSTPKVVRPRRQSVMLPDPLAKVLRDLANQHDATLVGEIHRAVSVYAFLLKEHEKGNSVLIRSEGDTTDRELILDLLTPKE